jgi:hypothetical protein
MREKILLPVIPIFLLGFVVIAEARVNSLTTGVDVSLDMDNRTFKNDTATEVVSPTNIDYDYRKITTTPSFSFKSDDIKDRIEFKYAPGLKYDLNGKGTDLDQRVDLLLQRSLLKEWKIKINELYINTDDSTQTSTPSTSSENNTESVSNVNSNQISSQLGRRRFWSNNAELGSEYTYLQDSLISAGYKYDVLRNDDSGLGGYQDFDRHTGYMTVSYRFDPRWKATVGGQYIRGLFNQDNTEATTLSQDMVEYVGNMALESFIFDKNPLALSYEYLGVRYDEPDRNDDTIQQMILSWKPEVSPQMRFDLGGGPSYEKREQTDANWGYNAHLKFDYSLEHTKINLGVEKGFGEDNFSGTTDSGFIDYWRVRGQIDHEFDKGLSCGIFALYQDEDHQNNTLASSLNTTNTTNTNQEMYNKKLYETGVNVRYNFWRWFTVSLGYTFSRLESDQNLQDNYDDHRILLTLGAEKEMWRW